MNFELAKSNLKIAVRNLLKYKVQNAISILCLAVGIICFSVTWHFVSAMWWHNYELCIDSECVEVIFRRDKDSTGIKPLEEEAFQILRDQKPASIQYLLFKEYNIEAPWILTDLDGKEWELQGGLTAVSPEYLHHYGFRSAITGKPIERLEPGTVIMSDGLWRKTLGGEIDPVGWHTSVRGDRVYTGTVSDVVRSNMRGQLEGMFIVSDTPFLSQFKNDFFLMYVVLAEGKTREDLYADLQKLYPDRHPAVSFPDNPYMMKIMALCGMFLFLGSMVLVIGLLGFLKMQLQLFHLRSREMALRRCMGARPWQLFWLLAIEVVIVFIITTLVALGLTMVVADYALPILYKMLSDYKMLRDSLYIDMEIICHRELWISLITTVLTLGIAALAVRRSLHVPLGMTAGRSNRINHTGRSIMLVSQYVFCILLLAVILGTYSYIKQTASSFHVPEDPSSIKQCMLINRSRNSDEMASEATQTSTFQYFTDSELASLPSMEQAGGVLLSSHFSSAEVDTMLYVNYRRLIGRDGIPFGYMYGVASANEQYFLALGLHPVAECGMDHKTMVPVFVRPEDADRFAKSLQAEEGARHRSVLADGQEYVSIGYVPIWPGMFNYSAFPPSYYMIVSEVEENILRETLSQWNDTDRYYYIFRPKAHRYAELTDELNDLYHEKCPTNLMPLEITNVYDTWFTQVRWAEMLQQLCWLLTIISLLSIILSVYSAISLDTRGREKEVAIRKVHGAKMWDILRLFGGYYVRLIAISSVITVPICLLVTYMASKEFYVVHPDFLPINSTRPFVSIAIMIVITLATIGQKIWRVARTNPAEVVKKE